MTEFDDIRPYNDDEVRPVIDKLMADTGLVSMLAAHKFPRLIRFAPKLLPWLLKQRLQRDLAGVHNVQTFQQLAADSMARAIRQSTSGFTFSGIERLDPAQSYLFVSNHRDIAMDPAFLNYALHLSEHKTFEIAIGDNLLTHPLSNDLMRLNRSFIVKRSVEGMRNKLAAMTQLSKYIRHVLNQDTSVWIAQREGRAKDGNDKTDPAIIKMFYIHGKNQQMPFADYIHRLNIVPVAISYEYDPCDGLKARELELRSQKQEYEKTANEDLQSIIRGISQPKGRVHVSVGTPLTETFETPEQVALAIDKQIATHYQLFASNIVALEWLSANWKALSSLPDLTVDKLAEIGEQAKQTWNRLEHKEFTRKASEFSQRMAHYPQHLQQHILEMYANPTINKYRLLLSGI